jgi:hypothetical protein
VNTETPRPTAPSQWGHAPIATRHDSEKTTPSGHAELRHWVAIDAPSSCSALPPLAISSLALEPPSSRGHQRLLRETYPVELSDIQDAVNQMLGRDPDQHRPPRLSWDGLLKALAAARITTAEQELIEAPIRLVLSDAARAELGTDQTEA